MRLVKSGMYWIDHESGETLDDQDVLELLSTLPDESFLSVNSDDEDDESEDRDVITSERAGLDDVARLGEYPRRVQAKVPPDWA